MSRPRSRRILVIASRVLSSKICGSTWNSPDTASLFFDANARLNIGVASRIWSRAFFGSLGSRSLFCRGSCAVVALPVLVVGEPLILPPGVVRTSVHASSYIVIQELIVFGYQVGFLVCVCDRRENS